MCNKNVLVLHHDDRDGYMSGAIVESYFILSEKENYSRTYVAINYEKSLQDVVNAERTKIIEEDSESDIDFIYLLDFSISKKHDKNKEFIEKFYTLYPKSNLIYIDHHLTTIESIDKNILSAIDGLRIIGVSGAALCWMYFFSPLNCVESLLHFNNTGKEVPKPLVWEFIEESRMPQLIEYTHRYDIFDLDEQVLEFNYGYNTLDIETMTNHLDTYETVEEFIQRGIIIKDYIDECNKKIVKSYGVPYEFTYSQPESDNSVVYKVLTLNHNVFSSLVYGETINDYDFVLTWAKKDYVYRCSVYTTKDIDVSKIAMQFGGGGHKAAAGFTLNKPFWELPQFSKI